MMSALDLDKMIQQIRSKAATLSEEKVIDYVATKDSDHLSLCILRLLKLHDEFSEVAKNVQGLITSTGNKNTADVTEYTALFASQLPRLPITIATRENLQILISIIKGLNKRYQQLDRGTLTGQPFKLFAKKTRIELFKPILDSAQVLEQLVVLSKQCDELRALGVPEIRIVYFMELMAAARKEHPQYSLEQLVESNPLIDKVLKLDIALDPALEAHHAKSVPLGVEPTPPTTETKTSARPGKN